MTRDPQLIVLSGREKRINKIIDRGYILPGELNDYPELMGVIPILGSIAAAIPTGITMIGDILDKIRGKNDTSDLLQAQMIQQQQQAAQFNKIMLTAGVGIAAIMMFSIVTRKK